MPVFTNLQIMEVYDYGAYEADRLNSQKRLGRISDRKKLRSGMKKLMILEKKRLSFSRNSVNWNISSGKTQMLKAFGLLMMSTDMLY
jgi:hypothetical protein